MTSEPGTEATQALIDENRALLAEQKLHRADVLAILAATPAADSRGLDVERLARAIDALPPLPFGLLNQKMLIEVSALPTSRQWAEVIAREYAALTDPAPAT